MTSTAFQAGEKDQTTRIDLTEHPDSRVLSARMPRKKPQEKKSPSVLSVETAYELIPSEVSQRTKPAQNNFSDATAISHVKRHNVAINGNRIEIYYFRFIDTVNGPRRF